MVVILSGACSVGKHDLTNRLLNDPDLDLVYSVSLTTRPKKEKEVDGKDYYFVDFASFAQAVKDTGIGITPEDLPRIFERGYTGYNGRMDKKATGIGLYLTKQIVKNLSYFVNIHNPSKNEGQLDFLVSVKTTSHKKKSTLLHLFCFFYNN